MNFVYSMLKIKRSVQFGFEDLKDLQDQSNSIDNKY